jgi:hypothetical protein
LADDPHSVEEAFQIMALTVGQWRQIVADNPGNVELTGFLANSLASLADFEFRHHRFEAALKLASEAVELEKATVRRFPKPDYLGYLSRSYQFLVEALNGLGQHREGAQAASDLARFRWYDASRVYDAACYLAKTSSASERNRGLPDSERISMSETFASDAVALLKRASDLGFFTMPGMMEHARKDTDLDALRSRSDFQLLMLDLAFPSDPFTGPR